MAISDDLQSLLNIYAGAYQVGDAKRCASVFSQDGELHSPYAPPAFGRHAIEALHMVWTADGGGEKQLKITSAGSSGDLAWCLANFSEDHAAASGTSLMVFERQGDGKWLVRICSLNGSEPEATG